MSPGVNVEETKKHSETRTLLRKAAREIRLTGFIDFRRYLHNLYKWVKKRSESYSYIQFSIDIGLGKSNASRLIITGQRNLSNQHATDIAANLGLRGHKALYYEGLVRYNNARTLPEREEVFSELMHSKSKIEPESLTPDQIAYFASWINPVVKEAAAAQEFKPDVDWIQESINFPVRRDEVKRAMTLMTQLGLFQYNESSDSYSSTQKEVHFKKIDDLAAIRYHQAMIDAGKESLTRLPGNEREIAGVTALLSKESFEYIREKLRALADEVEQLEKTNRTANDREVYQLNMQLFPFTAMNRKD